MEEKSYCPMHEVPILWVNQKLLLPTYVCVKCGGEHNTTLCTKDPTAPATCALCGGDHPASYKGCVIYKNLQHARGKTHHPVNPTATQTSTTPVNINDAHQFPPYIAHCITSQPPSHHLLHTPVLSHTTSNRPTRPTSCQFSLTNLKQCSTN